uniref:Non-specific serine/threonine protein kinase n=1 Tax=Steinernema glaseri TaxID=37863 RepID=A0A1I7Z9S5_9BILA
MEWVIQCVSYNAVSYEDLCPLWEYCRIPSKRAMIFEPILNGVSPVYLATHALEACKIVTGCDDVSASELCAFGRSILQAEVSSEAKRPILRSVWRRMSKLSSLRSYVQCCDVWIEFAVRFFSLHELSVILDSLLKKIMPDKKYENFYANLLSILHKMVEHVKEIDELLVLDHFATLIELFREDELKSKSATLVLNAVVNKHKIRSITDFSLANQVVWIAKRLHDSMELSAAITQETLAPEAILIEAALDRFDLNSDPERGLSVLVDARSALYNLNTIIRYLVLRVNELALASKSTTRLSARGKASYIRACLAYGFITIASLNDPTDKIRLYVQSVQVALSANALSQTDAIVRECIELLAVLDKPPAIYLTLCSSLLGVLLVVPDSPSKPPLYLFKAFLNAIQRYSWPMVCPEKGRLFIRCLCWLSVSRQPDYPIRIGHVQSNDQVYGGSPTFLKEVDDLSNMIFAMLIEMADDEEARPRRPPHISMELLEAMVAVGDLKDDDMAQLALNLYTVCSSFAEFSARTRTVIMALKETGHPLFAGFPSRNF